MWSHSLLCLDHWKQNGPIEITFALSPFCFSLSSFPNPGAWSSHVFTPSPWSSFHVAISIHECHLAPSLGLDQPISHPHLEHRVSPNRFHQLAKTNLGLSTCDGSALTQVDSWLSMLCVFWITFHVMCCLYGSYLSCNVHNRLSLIDSICVSCLFFV